MLVTTLLASPRSHDWGDGGHAGWFWFPWWLLTVALIVLLVWFVARAGWRRRAHPGTERAREILAQRYASGEISANEYRERLADL
ncbi:MAG TPA: SHOCT domain-containing protein [Nitriliruptorales bacterium]|nr:SHOCT domain-containing protein [Nitriliruptorales bacterium]